MFADDKHRSHLIEHLRRPRRFTVDDVVDACSPINGKAEGGKTTSDADVAQRLAHEVSAVGILVVERGGRLGIVGQRIVGDIGVSPIRFVIIRGLIVGGDDVIAQLGRSINPFIQTQPRVLIVIDMEDDKAATWKITIPPQASLAGMLLTVCVVESNVGVSHPIIMRS